MNVVPRNLVARIPDGVSFEEAAFGTLGAIALQGVRRAEIGLGDRVAVLGLGLLGQITVQMLRAAGAVAIGVDVRADRVERAPALGLDHGFTIAERDFVAGVLERTDGRGADAVIVTAAGGDAGLLNKAFEATRRKGRVVLVGDVPIRIQRDKIYKKEIDFLISTSYGPGRYDPAYEEKGQDYPFGYVRWTEGRNLEEVLRLIATGGLKREAARRRHAPGRGRLGGLRLARRREPPDRHPARLQARRAEDAVAASTSRGAATDAAPAGGFGVGVVGFGSYFRAMLLPLLREHTGFRLAAACSRSGLTVRAAVENDGFAKGTTDYRELIADPAVDVVYVATRHDLHFEIARAAVEAGKHVFVEKPMTMTVARGPRARRGRRPQGRAADRRLQPALLAARRAAPRAARTDRGAEDDPLPRERRRAAARALAARPASRAAAGCSARACTSSTCCASWPARSRCACARSRPRGKARDEAWSRSSSRTARSAPSSTRAAAPRGSARSASRSSPAARASCSTTTGASRCTASRRKASRRARSRRARRSSSRTSTARCAARRPSA